jgi:hypothetical protein
VYALFVKHFHFETRSTIAVLVLLLSLGAGERSVGQQVASIRTKWEVDLRAVIGGAPLGVIAGHGHETHGKPRTSLWFLDNDTIIASFVTREGEPSVSVRGDSNSLPLRLRVVILDADKGRIIATRAWPTESRIAGIVAAHDDQFVAQTANVLTSYSSALNELKKLKLPPTDDPLDWSAHSSPTGKSVLFVTTDLQTSSAVQWAFVNTDDLKLVRLWDEVQSGWVGISDTNIAMATCVWLRGCESTIQVRTLNSEWKTVASASGHNEPPPQFVTDDQFFLWANPARLIGVNGTTIFAEAIPARRCWWGSVYASSQGQRFIVPFCRQTGHVESLDLSGREELKEILVYDAPFRGVSRRLEVKGKKTIGFSLVALSPDGSKLAVLNGQSVRVFDLPPFAK